MEDDFISPKVKYGKQILDYIDTEIAEVRGNISRAEIKLGSMKDRLNTLYTERKTLLKSLCDEEMKYTATEAPIKELINKDFEKLLNNVTEQCKSLEGEE